MTREEPPKKPTYRELWWDQGASLLDIWQAADTRIDPYTLNLLWYGSLVPRYLAEQALNEYNRIFGTCYTFDQVAMPTMESLGYGRRFHVKEGETSMALGWSWEYYG
jgi:hypothetical protein